MLSPGKISRLRELPRYALFLLVPDWTLIRTAPQVATLSAGVEIGQLTLKNLWKCALPLQTMYKLLHLNNLVKASLAHNRYLGAQESSIIELTALDRFAIPHNFRRGAGLR